MKFSDLQGWIKEHEIMLSKVVKQTSRIFSHCESGDDYKVIESEVENRDRLILVLENIQGNVENCLQEIIDAKVMLTADQIQFIKNWQANMTSKMNDVFAWDKKIVSFLVEERDATTQEIAQVFKSKESIRGYNLKDVKP